MISTTDDAPWSAIDSVIAVFVYPFRVARFLWAAGWYAPSISVKDAQ
jgi:hypothetical protein